LINIIILEEILEVFLSNFQKRFIVSLFAFPVIYLLIYKKFFFSIFLCIVFLISFYEWFKINKKKKFLFIIGIFTLFLAAYSTITFYFKNSHNFFFFWILLIVWLTDIGGYIFGKFFGGKKLTKISPNKTWSGAFGSIVLSQFAGVVFFLNSTLEINFQLFSIQFFFSVIAQAGDLIMSYCKRLNKIKDSSKLLPGHGGILDRIDGLIWVMILANIIL